MFNDYRFEKEQVIQKTLIQIRKIAHITS